MKLNGQKLEGPNEVLVVLPRGENLIAIKARAVLSYDEFNKLLPPPTPPIKIVRGGGKQPDFEHPTFLAQMQEYGQLKTAWMFIQSLKATEGLEWEEVDYADPNTWLNYPKELEKAGFSDFELQRILRAVMEANCLDEKKLEEARERFLSGKILLPESSTSQKEEVLNTPSGEPAKDLQLDLQA